MNNWNDITSPETRKQKLNTYIKKINKNITSADGYVTAEKNMALFKKFQEVFEKLDDTDIQMRAGEIVSIKGVEVLTNNLLFIDGSRNSKLNIKNDNKMCSYYSYKSFATY